MVATIPRPQLLVERFLPWLVLFILIFYTYTKFFLVPSAGFEFTTGQISEIFVDPGGANALQVGDSLIQIGPVRWEDFEKDLRLTLFDGVEPGEQVRLIVDRNGEIVTVDWVFPGSTRIQTLQQLNSQWWIVYVFWMAGTAALLLIRPKNLSWFLLVAVSYLTAIWLVAGSGPSHWHVAGSALVLRAAVWLSVPVYMHFHWIFPVPLARIPVWAWGLLYFLAIALAVLEVFQLLPDTAFYLGFLIAIVASIVFMILKLFFQSGHRGEILILAAGLALVFLPPLGVSLAFLLGSIPSAFVQGGSLLALPALPGAYFFAVYRNQFTGQGRRIKRLLTFYILAIMIGTIFIILLSLLHIDVSLEGPTFSYGISVTLIAGIIAAVGFFPFLALPALPKAGLVQNPSPLGLELRANRLVAQFLFVILVGTVLTSLFLLGYFNLGYPEAVLPLGASLLILAAILTLIGFEPFKRLVDRFLLDIPLPPEHLLETYSERITTSLDAASLSYLLKDELLPSLFVRQSALVYLDENDLEILFTLGVDEDQLPEDIDLTAPPGQEGEFPHLSFEDQLLEISWIRLILPLKADDRLIGLWMLGKRDPDNIYTPGDISVLQTIANQTSVALTNIVQAKRLHALYQADIERQENERARLSRGLHDEVLNELASLGIFVGDLDKISAFQEGVQKINTYLRQVIEDLRPAMLTYGLHAGLEGLADELSEREPSISIRFEIPKTDIRYPPQVEQHLFRILQQACENAIRHAGPTTICIRGSLEPHYCSLTVEDDGRGFPTGKYLGVSGLLAKKHYGLVGMVERASLIGASIEIDSVEGKGTTIRVVWRSAG